jgi:hypothetical protein
MATRHLDVVSEKRADLIQKLDKFLTHYFDYNLIKFSIGLGLKFTYLYA